MTRVSFVPTSAIATGMASRYRYWSGRSGRRYLFTCVDADWLKDCHEAIALECEGDRIVWIGEAEAFPPGKAIAGEGGRGLIFVHLLASDSVERRNVIDDLADLLDHGGDGGNVLRFAA
ncbi:hypothetical protein SAMN05216548_106154 [Faunimonas pinastri]|uniref:Uncharacterized protein n=1 Tax=Faunimonas pinastri TaxID=1855383 RepID=A0A1H9HT91_9HYPH|nr:hypothetical protein [Faunimonas pinastri]SEQ65517.1 hypothetical protein SAMN05216548_106154 [Faunimonas pinastri]